MVDETIAQVIEVLRLEAEAITKTIDHIGSETTDVVNQLEQCEGRIIVSGMGKMGWVGRKAAATFCSTGSPAVFLHPSEAAHGDLGIVSNNDVLLVLSNSGETRELLQLLPFMKRFGVSTIGLVGNVNSSLAQSCDLVIDLSVEREADPIALAPTTSTTVTLAMCDALAIALIKRRGFTKEQFAIFHPGGHLGARLLVHVSDIMQSGEKIPKLLADGATLEDAIGVISEKGLGAVFVTDRDQRVIGVVTDGDLRRTIESAAGGSQWKVWREPLVDHMSHQPKKIASQALAAEALRLMEDNEITILPVIDDQSAIVGVIHMHDLIRAGLA